MTFDLSESKKYMFGNFLRQTGSLKPRPQESVKIFFQIPNCVKNTEMMTPDLVGNHCERVV